mgnify:FL=1|tara:strand:- start:492 stop:635 length:144 start_codon:yes stop_codon:yes gene_type:complete
MINDKKILVIFIVLIALGSCGRKGDLLPPPNLNSLLSSDFIAEVNND